MIEIEQEFGRLDWDTPEYPSRQMMNGGGDPSKLNPHWNQIYNQLLSGPKNWKEFLKYIDRAAVVCQVDHEVERKKQLDLFIAKRRSKK